MTEQICLASFVDQAVLPALAPCRSVVPIVATLAKRREIEQVRSLWPVVVHMSSRKHNLCAGDWMRCPMLRATPLTMPACPDEAHEA